MVRSFDAPEGREVSLKGAGTLSNRQGMEALERLMAQSSRAQVAVMPIDWDAWKVAYAAFTTSPFLSRVAGSTGTEAKAVGNLRESLQAAADEMKPAMLRQFVAEAVARVMRLPHETLDLERPLSTLGFDSLMAVELKNRVEAELGLVVPMVQFLQGPSVAELSALLLERLHQQPAPSVAAASAPPQEDEAVLMRLDSMSDSEVDALLAELLTEEERES